MRNHFSTITLALIAALSSSCALLARHNFDQGMAHFNRGRFAEAIPYFEAATRDDPNSAQAYLYLGRAHLSQSNWCAAIQPLRTAFRLAPTESQEEIVNLIIDAGFAAALSDFRFSDRMDTRQRLKESL